jgi:hypothetical protein
MVLRWLSQLKVQFWWIWIRWDLWEIYSFRSCDVGKLQSHFIKKNPTRCNNVSEFYYTLFIWSSTCFGRHTAHHQKPKTALAASGFSYVKGCWTCSWWTFSGTVCAWQRPPTARPTTFHVWKTRGCQCGFRLLMMGGVSPETCWASYK